MQSEGYLMLLFTTSDDVVRPYDNFVRPYDRL